MLVVVEVGVALSRPPKLDRLSKVIVEIDFDPLTQNWFDAELEAELTATYMVIARKDVVMPVYSKVVDILEV